MDSQKTILAAIDTSSEDTEIFSKRNLGLLKYV